MSATETKVSELATTPPAAGDSVLVVDASQNASRRVTIGMLPLAGTVDNSKLISGIFPAITGLGAQSQVLNMGANRITGIADPVNQGDAVTRRYFEANLPSTRSDEDLRTFIVNNSVREVEDLTDVTVSGPADGHLLVREGADWVNRGGNFDRITGIGVQGRALNMGANKVANVATPTLGADAANRAYVDGEIAKVPTGGSGSGATTLAALTDTSISAPSNGQVLTYDSVSRTWRNRPAPSGSGTLADGSVLNRHLATNSVSTIKIQNGAVTAAKIADKSVGNGHLVGGSYPAITGLGTLASPLTLAKHQSVDILEDDDGAAYRKKVRLSDFEIYTRRVTREFADVPAGGPVFRTLRIDRDSEPMMRLGRERRGITDAQVQNAESGITQDTQAAYHDVEFYETMALVGDEPRYIHVHNTDVPGSGGMVLGGIRGLGKARVPTYDTATQLMEVIDYGGVRIGTVAGKDQGRVALYKHDGAKDREDLVLDDSGLHLENVTAVHYGPAILPDDTTTFDMEGAHTQKVTIRNGSANITPAVQNNRLGREIRVIIENRRGGNMRIVWPAGWGATGPNVSINTNQTRVITLIGLGTGATEVDVGI